MAFIPNHLHLLVKGYCNNPPRESETLNDWFRTLITKIRMKVVCGPTSVYVEDEGNEGLTGSVNLSSSHSSIHIWSELELPMFQFDLYSCSDFTAEEVIEHLNEFDLTSYNYMVIDRNTDEFKIIESGSK